MEDKLEKLIADLKNIAMEEENALYIVGGYIRDKLFDQKINPKDIDFVYGGDICLLIEKLNPMGYKFYPVKAEEGIFATEISGFHIDISKMKGNSIEEDLNKRDYTVNAIALNLINMKIVDLFKGRRAIKSRILQEVSERSLADDPVRILRGMRFYIEHGFHFSLHTEEHVVEFAPMLKAAKGERVFKELMSIIQCDVDGRAFELLDNYKILENILPYMKELKTIGKSSYGQLDIFSHMDLTYKTYKELLAGRIILNNIEVDIFNKPLGNFTLSEYVGFACFVHDIGKYKSVDNYHQVGAEIIEKKCNELKFSREALIIVVSIVKNHGVPLELFNLADESKFNRAAYRFFQANERYVQIILTASFCDVYADRIYDYENEKINFKKFIDKLLKLFEEYNNIVSNNWINGDFIIEKTNIRGKDIGTIIDEVNQLIFSRGIKCRNEAQEYVISKYGGR